MLLFSSMDKFRAAEIRLINREDIRCKIKIKKLHLEIIEAAVRIHKI